MADTYRKDPEAIGRLPGSSPDHPAERNRAGLRNEYWDNKEPGIYVDVVSGEPLFASVSKYDSHSGWPSFTVPIEPGNVIERQDASHAMIRTEVAPPTATATGAPVPDGPAQEGAFGTASTPPPSASSRSMTWNARDTAPTARSSSPHATLERIMTTEKPSSLAAASGACRISSASSPACSRPGRLHRR